MWIKVNDAEHATILASLRLMMQQRDIPSDLLNIATNMGQVTPLGRDEIGELCERINTEAVSDDSISDIVARIHAAPSSTLRGEKHGR